MTLAKTATKRKPAADLKPKPTKTASKAKQPSDLNGDDDFAIVELAQREYVARPKSQPESIKKTDKKLLRAMLYQMVLARRFEKKCAEVYRMGKIGGFSHLYIGQEAIAVGSMMALEST